MTVRPPSNALFLPPWLIRRLAAGECGALPAGWSERGATCFIDLVGFTALTERHAAMGPEGAERLRETIDVHFALVIARLAEAGGEVAAFAGDAMLAVFFDQRHGGARAAARAALSGAVAIQTLARNGAAGVLPQRVSLSHGTVQTWALAPGGGEGIHVLGGEAVAGLGVPHRHAAAGEVVATTAFTTTAGVSGEPRPEGAQCLHGTGISLGHAEVGAAVRLATDPGLDADTVARWLPRLVRERQSAGQSAWLNEFRTVTVCFTSIDVGVSPSPAELDRAVAPMVANVTHHGGDVLDLVIDEKGCTLLAAFGLPGHSHGDDAARALRAASLMGAPVGVATGRIYTGLLGSPVRRSYGGIGTPMNLAARLLAHAGGGVRIDEATARAVAGKVDVAPAGTLAVKGLERPVNSYVPLEGPATRRRPAAAPVGRASERARLLEALDAGPGRLRGAILGEPGIGKSMLVNQLASAAEARGAYLIDGEGGAVEQQAPYFAWRRVFDALVEGWTLDDTLALLGSELAQRASLLNGTWRFVAPGSLAASQMESAARADAVADLTCALLERRLRRGRVLLAIDDAHWLDTASCRLLSQVESRLPGLDILIGARPLGDDANSDLRALVARLDRVDLGAMSRVEVGQMVRHLLGDEPPAGLVETVYGRGGGHPFYCEQLVLAMCDASVLRSTANGWVLDEEEASRTFPAHVEGVVMARIDALAPAAQLTAKVASVVGRSFPERAVGDVLPREADPGKVPESLANLSRQGLIAPEPSDSAPSWSFRHAITHEVAYNLLPFAQRRALHHRVGQWYQEHAGGEPDWAVLAWHYERAAADEEAISALENAATVAMRQHAHADARDLLGRALALARGPVQAGREARWAAMLGASSLNLVDYPRAKFHFRHALARMGLGVPEGRVGLVFDLLLGCARQAWHLFAGVRSRPDGGERARMRAVAESHQGLAEAAYFSLELPELLHANVSAINYAELAGEPRELALAYGSGAIGAGVGGLHRLAARWRRAARESAGGSGHLPTVAYVELIGSVYHQAMGELADGIAASQRAIEGFRTLGDNQRAASAYASLGFARLALGDLSAAHAAMDTFRGYLPRSGNVQLRAWSAAYDAWTLESRQLDPVAVASELERVLGEGPHHAERVLLLGVLAGVEQRLGRLDVAMVHAREVLRLAEASPPTTGFQFWPLGSTFDAVLANHRVSPCPAELKRALAALGTFARMAPVGQAELVRAREALAGRSA